MEARGGRFRAMGTEVEVLAVPALPDGALDRVRALFQEVEAALSRFLPESELSRLNASGGRPFMPSALLRTVLSGAIEAAASTGGMFDPTVLEALEASGYRRSFDAMNDASPARPAQTRGDYRSVRFNDDGSVVLQDDVRVDLGGYAKGWTVDAAAELMAGCESWLVNAGGDLRAAGTGPEGEGWLVGVENPLDPEWDVGVLRVTDAAIATSSTHRRRWQTQDGPAHHIIDPRTGRPAETDLAAATVMAATAAQAEVAAKTALLLGTAEGRRYVESAGGAGAVLVSKGGQVAWTGIMEAVRAA